MNCPYCGAGVAIGAGHCEQCGVAIEWRSDEAEFEDPGGFVEVHRVYDPSSMPVIESLLDANGILFMIANLRLQDLAWFGRLVSGYSFLFGPPVVKVPEIHAEEARDLLATARPTLSTLPDE